MKYIKKYAAATDDAVREDGFLRTKNELPCIMCSAPTLFVDIYSEGRFCSEACCDKFYKQISEEIHNDVA